jgi:hypothetical protein
MALILAPWLALWASLFPPADAVRVEDLDGFAPRWTECDDAIAFCRARAKWLDAQVSFHGDDRWWAAQFQPAIDDNEYRQSVWNDLRDAWYHRACASGCDPDTLIYLGPDQTLSAREWYIRRTLASLADVRRAIGRDAYACPIYFRRID